MKSLYFVSGSARLTRPGIQKTSSVFRVLYSYRITFIFARIDLSTESRWVDLGVNKSRESSTTVRGKQVPSRGDRADFRIFFHRWFWQLQESLQHQSITLRVMTYGSSNWVCTVMSHGQVDQKANQLNMTSGHGHFAFQHLRKEESTQPRAQDWKLLGNESRCQAS